MKERLNKPRVFLSHSSTDVPFIERIEADFGRCQIDSWRDQKDIRDGQPWLDSIFEDGIPTCDAILAYFTKSALESPMVAKEVDSAILRRLKDSNIAFLPYVDGGETRAQLRVDIQTLHCREWNEDNFYKILPSVVAEIWRSFLERSINTAVLSERNRRLELELELQEIQQSNSSPFTATEIAEFSYLYERLNRELECTANIIRSNGRAEKEEVVRSYRITFSLLPVFFHFARENPEYLTLYFERYLESDRIFELPFEKKFKLKENEYFELESPDLLLDLKMYGLVAGRTTAKQRFGFFFTPKMLRLLFWMEFNKLVSDDSQLKIHKSR
jgi:hypothetical protein